MAMPFTHYLRVRYAECDAQQVVFNANYGAYVDVAATEFMRLVWPGGYQTLLDLGMDTQVVQLNTGWKSSAKFDDVLAISVRTKSVGNTSYTLTLEFRNHETQAVVAESEIVYVMISVQSLKSVPIPDDLRAKLEVGAPDQFTNHAGI
ncbi:acyl-CoA thioesterase [Arenicella xantha]|uniref:Acyl-CoA thioester hydrolase n=1 Tax=Arenicella xantha TaxID=644221 RepID=A0A395JLH5_9GAMM|nr:thioesterase family protein [Arenicella xantha]RBP51646.1 acyl-CoA thioester hydrolase [Arenicella xantha]